MSHSPLKVNSADEKTKVIHLWCGPRSLSTATMYSFSRRPDTEVFDEPLYASWLHKNPSIFRPYREDLCQGVNVDGNAVLKQINNFQAKKILFLKHVAKQITPDLDDSLLFTENSVHIFLVRDPLEMILAWNKVSDVHQEECSLDTMSLPNLLTFYSKIRKMTGSAPIVIDSSILKAHPRETLSELCGSLDIPFYEEQLSWPVGPKPDIDGLWAKYWYSTVHASSGFHCGEHSMDSTYSTAAVATCYSTALSPEQVDLYREALPFYDILRRNAIGRDMLNPGSSVNTMLSTATSSSSSTTKTPSTIIDHGIVMSTGSDHDSNTNAAALAAASFSAPGSSEKSTKSTDSAGTTGSTAISSVNNVPVAVPTVSYFNKRQKLSDSRNESVLVWIGDRLVPRELAKVSVFDSTVQGGDAVWEGLRIYNHSVFKMEEHISRLLDSSKAMAFTNVPTREFIKTAIFRTLAANGMTDNAHIRLTLSRGAKITSSMNPQFNVFGCNLIVLPEWKPVGDAATYDNSKGIKLITAAGRRNGPQCVDSKIHHCNLINNILPKIQANNAGAADALMLDPEGFVSETNATNVFMIKDGTVYTPHADYCLPGITRGVVMTICVSLKIPLVERRVSLAEFHCADEVFTTGTMGELTPVYELDGRNFSTNGEIFMRIQKEYRELTQTLGVKLPF